MNLQTLVVSGSVDTFIMTKEKSYDAFLINGHNCALVWLKFIYSEKATKFCKIFPLLLTTVHTVKSKGKISQNFSQNI